MVKSAREDESDSDLVCVGKIVGAIGVSGEVRLHSFCEDPEAISDYSPLFSEDGKIRLELRIKRRIKGGLAARVSGVDTREQAQALKGISLFARREVFPETEEDEFYHFDLVGLTVLDQSGQRTGTVASVANHGTGDILVVADDEGNEEFVSFSSSRVPEVNVREGFLVVSGSGEAD